ncbi:hypothetical protein [Duganella sp. BJB1802]|nr:hypothetical protein [Duganella sp. BJB1802]
MVARLALNCLRTCRPRTLLASNLATILAVESLALGTALELDAALSAA